MKIKYEIFKKDNPGEYTTSFSISTTRNKMINDKGTAATIRKRTSIGWALVGNISFEDITNEDIYNYIYWNETLLNTDDQSSITASIYKNLADECQRRIPNGSKKFKYI